MRRSLAADGRRGSRCLHLAPELAVHLLARVPVHDPAQGGLCQHNPHGHGLLRRTGKSDGQHFGIPARGT